MSKGSVQGKLLNTELSTLITRPNYVHNICFAFDNCFDTQKVSESLGQTDRQTDTEPPVVIATLLTLLHYSPRCRA